MSNPFLDYGNEIETRSDMRRARKQSRAQEKALKKALAERDILFTLWKKWHDERKVELLVGERGEAARELADYLERMTIEDAPALLTLVRSGPWRDSGSDVKYVVLGLISRKLSYLREQAGLEPFDDPLPPKKNEFVIMREMLT